MNKYLEGNAKNIMCLLHRIAAFVRQHKLEDRTAEDIPQIFQNLALWHGTSSQPFINLAGIN